MTQTPANKRWWQTRDGRALLWLLALTTLVVGAGIGLRDPWPADEPRFTLVARTMVETGDYLFPQRGSQLYSDKPPVFMWLQALFYQISGSWRLAFMLPSLLSALATVGLCFDLARRFYGVRVAKVAGLALLFTVHFTYMMKRAQIDPVVIALITASAYCFLREAMDPRARRFWFLGFFFAGVGVITKGVGVLGLLMPLSVWLAAKLSLPGHRYLAPDAQRAARAHAGIRWPLGMLVLLAAIGIWVVPMLWTVWREHTPEQLAYARDILLGQTAERYAKPKHHFQPPWYFVGVMLSMWLPLMLVLPWVVGAWRKARHVRRVKVLAPLLFALLVVLFFSLSPAKRDMYILPALPMLVLAFAPVLAVAERRVGYQRLLLGFVGLLALGSLLIGLAAYFGEPKLERSLIEARGPHASFVYLWILLIVLGTSMLGMLFGLRTLRVPYRAYAALTAFWLGISVVAMPVLDGSSSARELMEEVASKLGPDDQLATVAFKEQDLLQADRSIVDFGYKTPKDVQLARAIAWLKGAPKQRYVLANKQFVDHCVSATNLRHSTVANRRQMWLFGLDAIRDECVSAETPP
ncbi:ArnT family glycosyltransferase [Ahniella affigens]|nr:glycosyltransferase family 39 protein [Ahniella affigens]